MSRHPTARKPILYWYTVIGIQDIGGLPLGVVMAESGDRNALGQGAVSSCKPAHSHAGEEPTAREVRESLERVPPWRLDDVPVTREPVRRLGRSSGCLSIEG